MATGVYKRTSDMNTGKHMLGRIPWNKGLTGMISSRVYTKTWTPEKQREYQKEWAKNKRANNISKSLVGRNLSEETKNKIRMAHLGKKRTPHSEETKKKMSLASKGKKKSLEHIKNMSLARMGSTGFWNGKKRPSMTGEKNPKWVKDRLKIIGRHNRNFHDPVYKQWVMNVKNRDGWKCKIANGDCSGRVEAHHILGWKDNPELRYQINNGITLCHAHHPRKRVDEAKLSPYFQKLVAEMN